MTWKKPGWMNSRKGLEQSYLTALVICCLSTARLHRFCWNPFAPIAAHPHRHVESSILNQASTTGATQPRANEEERGEQGAGNTETDKRKYHANNRKRDKTQISLLSPWCHRIKCDRLILVYLN